MNGQQCLVGRDYMFAVGNGFQHQRFGEGVAADQLANDVDIRMRDQCVRVGEQLDAIE